MKKPTLANQMILTLSVISILLGFLLFKKNKSIEIQKIKTDQLEQGYQIKFAEVEKLKDTTAILTDSIVKLNVEKSYVEIKLNQTEALNHSVINNSKVVRINKDTFGYIKNCDSALEQLSIYEEQNLEYRNLVDTLQFYQLKKDIITDSTIKELNKIGNYLFVGNIQLKNDTANLNSQLHDQKIETKNERRKGNKKLFIGAGIGGVIAFILTIL